MDRQKIVWKHNSYQGHAAMMQRQCTEIMEATTVTEATREMARLVRDGAEELQQLLKERVDP